MKNSYLVKDGRSDYVILLPEKSDIFTDFACKTLIDAIRKSTGATLEVEKKSAEKFVSIGETEAKKSAGIPENYGKDGFTAIEKGGNLYLFGEGVYGAVWAVYGFLEKAVGYKFFAKDEIRIEKRNSIDLAGFEYTYTPTLANRCSGFGLAKYDLEYATGLKAYAWYGQRLDGKYFWGSWAHNHVSEFITPAKYYKDHPEWFYQDENFRETDPERIKPVKSELCLSNAEMRDEFFKRLIERIEKESHATHFLLGHEDNGLFCDCENCKKIVAEIGKSGLYMDFVNDMARRIEAWRRINAPEREIAIGTFAYDSKTSFPPPVREVNGEYVPVDPRVVAEPNVFVMFAPIATIDHNKPITAKINSRLSTIISKWKSVCSRYAVWLYYGSFRRSFEFVDGIYRFKEDIRFFKDLGVECFYVESPSLKGAISFQAMTLYVLTSLEWNMELDTDALIDEFCEAYYKVAAPRVKEYFALMMDYCKKTRERIDYLTGERYAYGVSGMDTIPQGYWDLNIVYDASLVLDEADKLIKESDYSDKDKQILLDRVEIERMTLLHIQLEYFNRQTSVYDEARSINTYSMQKILELCDRMERDIKKFDFPRINGDGMAMETIEGWRERARNAARGWKDRIDAAHETFYSYCKDGE